MLENNLSISQMARSSGLTPHTLRYYERIGLILHVQRNTSAHRRYRNKDIEWIAFLKRLRDIGMPIREIKTYADLRAEGTHTAPARRKMLEHSHAEITAKIGVLQNNLTILDKKISTYQEVEAAHGLKQDKKYAQ